MTEEQFLQDIDQVIKDCFQSSENKFLKGYESLGVVIKDNVYSVFCRLSRWLPEEKHNFYQECIPKIKYNPHTYKDDFKEFLVKISDAKYRMMYKCYTTVILRNPIID